MTAAHKRRPNPPPAPLARTERLLVPAFALVANPNDKQAPINAKRTTAQLDHDARRMGLRNAEALLGVIVEAVAAHGCGRAEVDRTIDGYRVRAPGFRRTAAS